MIFPQIQSNHSNCIHIRPNNFVVNQYESIEEFSIVEVNKIRIKSNIHFPFIPFQEFQIKHVICMI